jgi:serine phosphatase RsbU (regulator of sigma subunit)
MINFKNKFIKKIVFIEKLLYHNFVHKIGVNVFLTISLTLFLGVVDFLSGYEFSFQFFYFIPLFIISYNFRVSKIGLIFFVLFVALIWFAADYYSGHRYSNSFLSFWSVFSRLIIFMAFSLILNSLLIQRYKINKINKELVRSGKLINDSINYAESIQQSFLPSFNQFNKIFENSFIIKKPKDVLSGDFFWFYKEENQISFAMVDCTGHGVPGALLSLITNVILNKIVIDQKINNPHKVLEQINVELLNFLQGNEKNVNDSMEITFCLYDFERKELKISQTSQNAIIVNRNAEINKIVANQSKIGKSYMKLKPSNFTNETILMQHDDSLYLYTDGFIDQFGFDNNKKFGNKRFYELLKEVHLENSKTQKQIIFSKFENWKGKISQIDDVTVVGINF